MFHGLLQEEFQWLLKYSPDPACSGLGPAAAFNIKKLIMKY